jgi:myosin-crossreactive antigen
MKTHTQIQNFRHTAVDIYKISVGCYVCGYNKHPSALCFDHLPETTKSDVVKNGYSKRSSAGGMYKLYSKKHTIQELIEEIKKCRVLCSNCHMELTHQNNQRIKANIDFNIDISQLEKILIDYEHESV